eukprot:2037391-Prymnesium_polylepis.1
MQLGGASLRLETRCSWRGGRGGSSEDARRTPLCTNCLVYAPWSLHAMHHETSHLTLLRGPLARAWPASTVSPPSALSPIEAFGRPHNLNRHLARVSAHDRWAHSHVQHVEGG